MLQNSVTELFNTSHTNYNLRNTDFRQECFSTRNYGKHSLTHFGLLLWSKINRELRSAPTLSNFKKGIRKTDIASLIDYSCNDVSFARVSISSPHHFTLFFGVTQFTIPRYCSRKLGGTVILYNELKLFVSLNCFNVDNLLLNFSQSRLAVSLWQDLVTAPFILTESEGCQSYSNLK